jgi:hypothetical protein
MTLLNANLHLGVHILYVNCFVQKSSEANTRKSRALNEESWARIITKSTRVVRWLTKDLTTHGTVIPARTE